MLHDDIELVRKALTPALRERIPTDVQVGAANGAKRAAEYRPFPVQKHFQPYNRNMAITNELFETALGVPGATPLIIPATNNRFQYFGIESNGVLFMPVSTRGPRTLPRPSKVRTRLAARLQPFLLPPESSVNDEIEIDVLLALIGFGRHRGSPNLIDWVSVLVPDESYKKSVYFLDLLSEDDYGYGVTDTPPVVQEVPPTALRLRTVAKEITT